MVVTRLPAFFLIPVLAAALSACGGGGGSDSGSTQSGPSGTAGTASTAQQVEGSDDNTAPGLFEPTPQPEQDVVETPAPAPQPGGNGKPAPEQDPAPAAMTATLSWQAPLTRANGTALSMGEIDQYIVRYGTQPDADAMTSEIIVEDGQAMETEITGLSEGTWHFAMRTVDQNGLESAWSGVVSKTVTR